MARRTYTTQQTGKGIKVVILLGWLMFAGGIGTYLALAGTLETLLGSALFILALCGVPVLFVGYFLQWWRHG